MGTVNVQIFGRDYPLVCDDGQEVHVRALAEDLDGRMRHLAGQLGNPAETMLWAMTALMLRDELEDSKTPKNKGISAGATVQDWEMMREAVELMAERLEQLAMRLESSYTP